MKKIYDFLKLSLVVIGTGILTGLAVMHLALRDTGDIEVPYIEGEELIAALEKVSEAGLNLKVAELAYDDEVPRNFIISQNPGAGAGLKAERDVRVVVSRGLRDIIMPDIREMTLYHAESVLERRGLKVSSTSRVHSAVKEEYVIAQLPPRGSQIENGTVVDILVSLGPRPEKFLLSDFTGRDAFEITGVIQRAGLKLGRIRHVATGNIMPGIVVEQDPAPGKPVARGDEVSLTVAKGEEGGKADKRTLTVYNYTLPKRSAGSVRVVSVNDDGEKEIYLRAHKEGQTVSILVEVAGTTSIRVYIGDELVEVKQFDPK